MARCFTLSRGTPPSPPASARDKRPGKGVVQSSTGDHGCVCGRLDADGNRARCPSSFGQRSCNARPGDVGTHRRRRRKGDDHPLGEQEARAATSHPRGRIARRLVRRGCWTNERQRRASPCRQMNQGETLSVAGGVCVERGVAIPARLTYRALWAGRRYQSSIEAVTAPAASREPRTPWFGVFWEVAPVDALLRHGGRC